MEAPLAPCLELRIRGCCVGNHAPTSVDRRRFKDGVNSIPRPLALTCERALTREALFPGWTLPTAPGAAISLTATARFADAEALSLELPLSANEERQVRIMGTRSLAGLFAVAMLASAIPEPASGGVHMVAEIQEFRLRSPEPRRVEIWVDGSRVRIDDSWQAAGASWNTMLYYGTQDVLFGVDQKERTYVRVDRLALTEIATKVRMLRVMLEARMQGLSAGQRATASRMLGTSELYDKDVLPLVTRDTGTREEVDGRDCRLVEIRRKDLVVGMAWVASWDRVALKEDSLRVFKKLASLLGELNGALKVPGVSTQLFEVFDAFEGFPLRVRWDRDGRPISNVRFISLKEEKTASQLFALPADYRERGLTNRVPASVAPAR